MTKVCVSCSVEKPVEQFKVYRPRGAAPRPFSYCKDCEREKNQEWRRNNRERARLLDRVGGLKRFGLTVEAYQKMCAAQDDACAICGDTGKTLCVDHCHATGKVRGLLCGKCNTGLGQFNDNCKLLAFAIEYLMGYRK